MSKGNVFENELLALIFTNVDVPLIGDAAGLQNSAAAGSLYVALHTANPGEAGTQTTSEAAYGSYARVAVARSGAGWTVATNSVTNAGVVTFPAATSGSETELFWSVGTDSSGAGKILYYGPLGTQVPELFTAATNDNITIPGHSLIVDDRIVFFPVPGDTFPTGLTEGTVYWVKTAATDVITISTTQGGATLDITAAGAGWAQKVVGLAVSAGITPSFAAGAIDIFED
jgi:hypothetical protein